jgi:hypothetical protein
MPAIWCRLASLMNRLASVNPYPVVFGIVKDVNEFNVTGEFVFHQLRIKKKLQYQAEIMLGRTG